MGRTYLTHITRAMLDAPDLEAITVKLQAKMLKAAMTEAASASDETVLRVLDAFAEPWCDRGGYQPHHRVGMH